MPSVHCSASWAALPHRPIQSFTPGLEAPSDLLISDGCDWSGVIAKLFAKSMRPTRKQGDGERYEAESRGFWDDGWERGFRSFSSPHRERPFHAPASSADVSDRRDPHHQRIGV